MAIPGRLLTLLMLVFFMPTGLTSRLRALPRSWLLEEREASRSEVLDGLRQFDDDGLIKVECKSSFVACFDESCFLLLLLPFFDASCLLQSKKSQGDSKYFHADNRMAHIDPIYKFFEVIIIKNDQAECIRPKTQDVIEASFLTCFLMRCGLNAFTNAN